MADAPLTLNAGSSSIRFARFECNTPIPRKPVLFGQIDAVGANAGDAVCISAAGSRVATLAAA